MVRDVISMSLPDSYWVEAELSEAREGYGGHCYLELIEKDERSNIMMTGLQILSR